jgi:hypothetical protein
MILERLSLEEAAHNGGATHKVTLTYADLTDNDASQTFNAAVVGAGQIARVLRGELKIPFVSSDATLISTTVTVDDTLSGAAGLLASQELNLAGTEVLELAGKGNPGSPGTSWTAGYTAADTITLTVACTAAKLLSSHTKGEWWCYLEIRNATQAR